MTTPQLYACLTYTDADAGLAFLTTLGFTEVLVVRDPDEPTRIVHAQLRWRDNGGLMFGSHRTDDLAAALTPGGAVVNLVVPTDDDVAATVARAVGAGARVIQEPHRPPHGGVSALIADAEDNYFNIDSYPGEG